MFLKLYQDSQESAESAETAAQVFPANFAKFFQKSIFIFYNENSLKMMENGYFMLKALFVLEIFKITNYILFIQKNGLIRKLWLILKFIASRQQIIINNTNNYEVQDKDMQLRYTYIYNIIYIYIYIYIY